jgi:hypothetical protein
MKRRCPKCGEEWEIKGPIGFREECPECAAFIHICTNCAHYVPATRGCRIPTTDPVHDRQSANFCEEFEFGSGGAGAAGEGAPARPAESNPSAEEARRRFEDLFRDSKK